MARRKQRAGPTGFLGYDAFVTSKDVAACLPLSRPRHRRGPDLWHDLAKIQEQFNAWARETGLPYAHLSRICAFSTGENY